MKTIAVATVVAAVGLGCACARQTEGAAVAGEPTTSSTAQRSTSSTSAASTPSPGSGFGVAETTRRPLEPMAQTCEPAGREPGSQQISFVQGARPDTPIIELLAPDNWKFAPSPVDPTLNLTGPNGLKGTVTVAPTELEPTEAFDKYSDDAMVKAPIASLSVLPGELCGYSGQKLMGMWSGSGGAPVEYRDRIAHVWTNSASYLVAIHLEGPQGALGYAAAEDLMMRDFGIEIP
ncbi:MAG: hypothetical protein QOK18_4356 [Mycobacterium sp.]|jgi:hypothetical protein|nr:hypothetical protein [Mycobacterium sp.]